MTKIESFEKDKDVVEESTPVWVKVFGIIAIILVLVFIGLHLTGNTLGGNHGAPAQNREQR